MGTEDARDGHEGNWYARNKEHALASNRAWRMANQDRIRAGRLRRQYGLSWEEYQKLIESHGNACAICGTSFNEAQLAVDHCHQSGRIRGLLCARCNCAIGSFNDSVKAIEGAIKYLRRCDRRQRKGATRNAAQEQG